MRLRHVHTRPGGNVKRFGYDRPDSKSHRCPTYFSVYACDLDVLVRSNEVRFFEVDARKRSDISRLRLAGAKILVRGVLIVA